MRCSGTFGVILRESDRIPHVCACVFLDDLDVAVCFYVGCRCDLSDRGFRICTRRITGKGWAAADLDLLHDL